jgi:hypothetical protein
MEALKQFLDYPDESIKVYPSHNMSDGSEDTYQAVEVEEGGDEKNFLGYYLVLTYAEALKTAMGDLVDNFWDSHYELEQQLLKDHPSVINAIDVEKWAEEEILCQQANSGNGMGDILASYDSMESEITVDGTTMFIYRVD